MTFRLAFDATQLPSFGAGTATYILNLIQGLSELPDRDFDLAVLAKNEDLERLNSRSPDVQIVTVPLLSRPYRLLWEQTRLPGLLARLQVDILHSPHYTVPLAGRVRRVVTVHDLTYIIMPGRHSAIRRSYFRWMIPKAARRADRIVCDSHQTARDLHRLYPDIPACKSTVVPLGVDPIYFRAVKAEEILRVKNAYRLTDPYVLHVGTIEPRKNVSTALEAVEIVARTGHPCTLVLAGKLGWESPGVRRRLEQSPRCRMLSYVPLSDLAALYAGAGALIMPSHYEGFGFPVLEAMAIGTPVVCSGKGSLREVVGDAALLPVGDRPEAYAVALRRALELGAERGPLVEHGKAWAAQFTWERTARLTAAAYRHVYQASASHTSPLLEKR